VGSNPIVLVNRLLRSPVLVRSFQSFTRTLLAVQFLNGYPTATAAEQHCQRG
jgi:hypothetical protein